MSGVILAEDNTLLREGLQRVLEHLGFSAPTTVADADALLAACERERFDLVITDVRMPPTHTDEGLRAAHRLRQRQPTLPIMILSQYVSAAYLDDLLTGAGDGGFGYLLKDRITDLADFGDALRRVAAGGTAIDPTVVATLMRQRRDPLSRLTPRESEVLAAMAEGHSNAAIAQRLFVTEAAVVKHIGNILLKLDLPPDDQHNRRVMAVLAYLRRR